MLSRCCQQPATPNMRSGWTLYAILWLFLTALVDYSWAMNDAQIKSLRCASSTAH